MAFDFDAIDEIRTEFITVEGTGVHPEVGHVRIGESIQQALHDAAIYTWGKMSTHMDEGGLYDPADSHSDSGYLFLPLDSPFSAKARFLHNEPSQGELDRPLENLPSIDLYIARMEDAHGSHISAVKKINDFAGPFQKHKWGKLSNNELVLDTEPKFQLHKDFDFFVDNDGIYIYHYKAFEYACNLQKIIRDSVESNLAELSTNSTFVDYDCLKAFSSGSIRAARAIASIRSNNYHQRLEADRLKHYCNLYKVGYVEVAGKITVETEHLTFVRIIARQILGVELVAGEHESFLSLNRKPL